MSIPQDALEKFYNFSEDAFTSIFSDRASSMIHHEIAAITEIQVGNIVDKVESKVYEKVENRSMVKRFFLVFVEVLQNVVKHGSKNGAGQVPVNFFIYLKDGRLITSFSNVVDKSDTPDLKTKYLEVNRMGRSELKAMYMDQLTTGEMSEKSGAGLGVMTVVLRSKNKSEVSSRDIGAGYDLFNCLFFIDG